MNRAVLELCADVALAAYEKPATIETDDAHALIVETSDLVVIGLRGTSPSRLVDLWRDAGSTLERIDPILGHVPESFTADAEQMFWRLMPKFFHSGKPIALTGHSKGASEAQLLAAMLTHAEPLYAPTYLAAFEPSPVGNLNGLLATQAGLATRLGTDPITSSPPGRKHAQPLTALAWDGPLPIDPLAYHSMAAVRAALLCQAVAA